MTHPRRVLVSLALVVLVASGCSGSGETSSDVVTVTPTGSVIQPGRPGEANTTHTGPVEITADPINEADAAFMAGMIVHHAQALEMVELAKDNLRDEQVRSLADRIEAAQLPEVTTMTAWLVHHDFAVPTEAEDLGVDVQGMGGRVSSTRHDGHGMDHDMAGMASAEDLNALEQARGQDADILFLQLMTRHHEGAQRMAEQHGVEGIDTRAIEISTGVHVEQTAEINRMADLLDRLTG